MPSTDPAFRDLPRIGRKAATLCRLRSVVPVPDFVVLPADLFHGSTLDSGTANWIAGEVARMGGDRFAVRSSADDEDGADLSFAGLLLSCLDVPAAEVPQAAARVARSADLRGVRAYRAAMALASLPAGARCAVIVQRQIDPRASGVAFTADPLTGDRDRVCVEAVPGRADALLAGHADGALWHVRDGRAAPDEPGPTWMPREDLGRIAALARRCEELLGGPQDVEWALDDTSLWLIQSRPITAQRPHPGGTTFDSSNVGENFPGLVSPLTYTLACRIYAAAFTRFLASCGVPDRVLRRFRPELGNLLARLDGRLYYNVTSWAALLGLLPGERANRRFLAEMLGMPRGFPPAAGAPGPLVRLGVALVLAVKLLVLQPAARRFGVRVAQALDQVPQDLDDQPAARLARHWRGLEEALLHDWTVPILNDLAAMLAVGLSRRALVVAAGPKGARAHAAALSGLGETVALEPVREMRCMAEQCRAVPGLADLLAQGQPPPPEASPGLAAAIARYLDRYGDRAPEELKLESPSLRYDPAPLLRAIAALSYDNPTAPSRPDRDAWTRLLRGRPATQWLVAVLLACARARLAARETLRFDRTRLFGCLRRLVVAMGRELAAAGALDEPRDVFFLTVDELLGAIEGSACDRDLRALVALRQREMDAFAGRPPLPERVVIPGPAGLAFRAGDAAPEPLPPGKTQVGQTRVGQGCSAGLATGRARIVTDATSPALAPGEILVAAQTDPGWVVLVAQAGGIVTERGSLMSHAAVLARELGLPCIVRVAEATWWLADAPVIDIDGGRGTVSRRG